MDLRCEVDGRIYYPVKMAEDSRHKTKPVILGLPAGEDPADYVIELATVEVQQLLGENHAAEKRDATVSRECDGWIDHGGSLRSG